MHDLATPSKMKIQNFKDVLRDGNCPFCMVKMIQLGEKNLRAELDKESPKSERNRKRYGVHIIA